MVKISDVCLYSAADTPSLLFSLAVVSSSTEPKLLRGGRELTHGYEMQLCCRLCARERNSGLLSLIVVYFEALWMCHPEGFSEGQEFC